MDSDQQLENTYETINGYKNDNESMASPAAQTFTAPRNAYLSSVNLYFTNKGMTSIPINMQIRNTESNGQPGDMVYGETSCNWEKVNAATWSNVKVGTPTKFKFDDPILLLSGHKYAIVLYSDSLEYQLQVSVVNHQVQMTDDIDSNQAEDYGNNSIGQVKGCLWYSLDGTDWERGDPSGILGANAGDVSLKFDVNAAKFNQDAYVEFNVNTDNFMYNHVNSGKYKSKYMNSISGITFNPSELTPFGTSINWVYSTNGGPYKALPLNKTLPVALNNSDTIRLRAYLHGSDGISPLIEKGSLNLFAQCGMSDTDTNKDTTRGLSTNQFNPNMPSDIQNSGEYISRTVVYSGYGQTDTNKFNQVYASFEQLDGSDYPVDLYVNLNPDNIDNSSIPNEWIQMTGYDEYSRNNDQTQYAVVDPRTSIPYDIDYTTGLANAPISVGDLSQHQYQEHAALTDEGNWTRYHFHLSLNRLAKTFKANSQITGTEVKFCLVFHSKDPQDQPKIRRFLTSVNKSDETENPGSHMV